MHGRLTLREFCVHAHAGSRVLRVQPAMRGRLKLRDFCVHILAGSRVLRVQPTMHCRLKLREFCVHIHDKQAVQPLRSVHGKLYVQSICVQRDERHRVRCVQHVPQWNISNQGVQRDE